MPVRVIAIPPSANFWDQAAGVLLQTPAWRDGKQDGVNSARDFSALSVMVPTFAHIQLLKAALARQIDGSFIPPVIATLSENLRQLPPQIGQFSISSSERLMTLYDSLRQQAWLKKLFTARRNTDLLPLAEILLTLSDELTKAMLPDLQRTPDSAEVMADARWQAALQTLSPRARTLLSDESQLVWSIWKTQLDANDAIAHRLKQMLRLAQQTSHLALQSLCWISPVAPDAMEQSFLDACSEHRDVSVITLDWQAQTLDPLLLAAWPEVQAEKSSEAVAPIALAATKTTTATTTITTAEPLAGIADLSLHASTNLEAEALFCAQTIVNWLQQGKTSLAIVAQDRAVARRLRALLERADIFVADETGWKLSTTRAAAALAAWLELIAARGDTVGLLDFLKSPFVFADTVDKAEQVMAIEVALRRANIQGGWQAIQDTLRDLPAEQNLIATLATQADYFSGQRKLCEWIALTQDTLTALGMQQVLQADAAGAQLLQMLQTLEQDCGRITQKFSIKEWRAFINLQMESTAFVQTIVDRRVVMLPLNGARLRCFDAVLMVGADADHLPSQPAETLFFANAVRRELGLATRETLQQQQLRDFTELLLANPVVVLSWQAHKNGEPNSVSPWIERLQLSLVAVSDIARSAGMHDRPVLPDHAAEITAQILRATPAVMPAPAAPQLLPQKLSASGYNSLVACPYQFFATRMLGLSGIAELSELPDKRDYGDWLHQILARFHQTMQQKAMGESERAALLQQISDEIFGKGLDASLAALGYYERWKKAIPLYLAWVSEREQQGWQFLFGEEQLEKKLHWEDGEITLHGRVDRIDEDADGAQVVLDYKSSSKEALNKKLKQGEDHQLPFYGLLSATPLHSAAYVPLDTAEKKIQTIEAPDYQIWQQSLQQQIINNMQAIADGAPLPATGPETVCQYCEVRGLCRKGAW